MLTKEYTYKRALEIKKEALLKKQRERDMMLNAAYSSNRRLAEIDRELASIGANLALTALSGDTKAVEAMKSHFQALSLEKQMILNKADVNDIAYDCSLCEDIGYINGKLCDCVKKLANAIAIDEYNSHMPINQCTFENFDLMYYSDKQDNAKKRMTYIFKLAKEYALNFNPQTSPNLLFLGGPGLGKTHLTMAIVSSVIKKGYIPVYGSAENLFSTIEKEKFQGENIGAYEQMQNCDLLVIDDLGTEMITAFTKSALYNLVNMRLLTKRPTIINTNLSMEEIIEKYAPRIASRLFGEFDVNQFLGTDIRQQKNLRKIE